MPVSDMGTLNFSPLQVEGGPQYIQMPIGTGSHLQWRDLGTGDFELERRDRIDLERVAFEADQFDLNSVLETYRPIDWQTVLEEVPLEREELLTIYSGGGTYPQLDQFTQDLQPIIKVNPIQGALLEVRLLESSPNIFGSPSAAAWLRSQANLERAHELGSLAATAILGEAYLTGRFAPPEGVTGLDYLERAAQGGAPSAFTALGEFYQRQAETEFQRINAATLLQRGLEMGDGNAAFGLAEYALEAGDVYQAIDNYVLVIGMGTGDRPGLARMRLAGTCDYYDVVCRPMTVGVVTSRAQGDLANGIPWLDSATDQFAPNYSFVQTMVPYLKADDKEERTKDDRSRALGAGEAPPNQAQNSTYFFNGFESEDQFFASADKAAGDDGYLLYVHGFNNNVEDALLTVSRMKQRGNLPGMPMVYSWPAGKELVRFGWFQNGVSFYSGYSRDVQMASNACLGFRRFLLDFAQRVGPENITLVGHSHGAKLIHNALTDCDFMEREPTPFPGSFRALIYAAPDIDLVQFGQSFAQLEGKAERIGIYVSAKDFAIDSSENIIRGGMPRLGGGSVGYFSDWIEVVDATAITDDATEAGHSYAFVEKAGLIDMGQFLAGIAPPRPCHSGKENRSPYRLAAGLCD